MSEDIIVVVHPAVKVVLEGEGDSWSAYAPSIPGCGSLGSSREEVTQQIEEALTSHLELLHEDGLKEIAEELAAGAAQRS